MALFAFARIACLFATIRSNSYIASPVVTLTLFSIFLNPTAKATFAAITRTYTFLTPDLWERNHILQDPYSVR